MINSRIKKLKEEIRIFKGFTKPARQYIGTLRKPNKTKDKFGELYFGNIRNCLINTRWGQLRVPFNHIGESIEIIVKIKELEK